MAAKPPFLSRNPTDGETLAVGGGFYGRGKLKTLSDRKSDLIDGLLPKLKIAIVPGQQCDPATLFEHVPQRMTLEIGFGGGEHLAFRAAAAPDEAFIGIEPFVNGMAKGLAAIATQGLANIRLYNRDAAELITVLTHQSFDEIVLLYPDPWPKRRHNKRRFVNQGSLAAFHRLLKHDGLFRFASDIDDYCAWTLAHVERSALFSWQAERASDWTNPYPGWPGTRYEAKAKRESRVPTYLTFRRVAHATSSP